MTPEDVMAAREAAIQEPMLNCWRLQPSMAGLNPAMTFGGWAAQPTAG